MPQWNCSCSNCQAARQGKIKSRSQSSIAISPDDGARWFLVNASPDLTSQIEATPDLQPSRSSSRNSPIAGILLTNADLDHVLGLFSLREGAAPLHLHATSSIRATLENCLGLTHVLGVFRGLVWHEPPMTFSSLEPGSQIPLDYCAIPLPGNPPPYDNADRDRQGVHSVAYQFRDKKNGRTLVVAPDVASVTQDLQNALNEADAALFDGTFWSPGELSEVRPGARSSDQMGHITMEQSIEFLKALPARTKAYVHINNTNPSLVPDSEQHRQLQAAGLQLAEDGMEFEL